MDNKIREIAEMLTIRDLLEKYPKGIISIVSDTFDLWKVLTEYLPALKDIIEKRNGKVVIRPDSGDPVDIICGTDSKQDIIKEKDITLANYEDWFNDMSYEHLECGQGFYEDTWEPIAEIEGKLYQVTVKAEIQSSKQDIGDRLYWVEGIDSVTITELEKTPANKGVIELLYEVFGGAKNSKGYIELPAYIGAIYGDSITPDRATKICERLKAKGFASTNIVFGIGSYTYQYNTRDTFGFAMKATYVEVADTEYSECYKDHKCYEAIDLGDENIDICSDGCVRAKPGVSCRNIFKDPITDDGTKKSATGLLNVTLEDGKYVLHDQVGEDGEAISELQLVFQDSTLFIDESLETIRKRLKDGNN